VFSSTWNWLSQCWPAGSPNSGVPARSRSPPTTSTLQLQSGRRMPASKEIASIELPAGASKIW
jgi:hypothetical protein